MGLVVFVGVVSMAILIVRAGTMPPISNQPGSGANVLKSPQVLTGVALAFVFGETSLGLYTYMLPMAADRGLARWGFAFIWAWGIGGVVGSRLVGHPIDAFGSNRLLPLVAIALLASFLVLSFIPQPVWWLIAILVWGASGWASVPTLQDALTRARHRHSATTSLVTFHMGAMYLGYAVGSALGTALLDSGTRAGALPVWAMGTQALAVILALIVAALGHRTLTEAN